MKTDVFSTRLIFQLVFLKGSTQSASPSIIRSGKCKIDYPNYYPTKKARGIETEAEKKEPHYRGCFVDLKTLTFSLTNESYSLKKALTDFDCAIQKLDAEEHGMISDQYLRYNINDTLCTYHLYLQAMKRYSKYNVKKHESKSYSPASIGKSYLNEMGIIPFLKQNPDFSRELLGKIMMTYVGGRSEDRIRKMAILVSYIDFTSMYPTVYVLLQMDKFLKAQRIIHYYSTKETQELLDTITKQDIANKEN